MKRPCRRNCFTGAMLATMMPLAGFSPSAGADESANKQMDESLGAESKQACFYTRDASDFDVLDASNLIVYAPTRSRAYHVTIAPPSNELRFANGLAFEGRGDRICGYAGESLMLRDPRMGRRYSIMNVRRLDPAGREQLLETYKNADGKKAVEKKDPEGADVERDLPAGEDT